MTFFELELVAFPEQRARPNGVTNLFGIKDKITSCCSHGRLRGTSMQMQQRGVMHTLYQYLENHGPQDCQALTMSASDTSFTTPQKTPNPQKIRSSACDALLPFRNIFTPVCLMPNGLERVGEGKISSWIEKLRVPAIG